LNITRYEPKLLGVTGDEDFTYSNYFLGRTATVATGEVPVANKGLPAQQVMIRDGAFKMRLDYFEFLQGRSENWVTALNLNSTLPEHLFPVKLPIKLFLDVGTYAEAFKKNADGSRLRYVAGLQLSLFKQILNVYAPVFYSKEFRENLKTFPELNTFSKRLTFSIDTQRFNLRRITGNKIPL
jgi:hypothetical protein